MAEITKMYRQNMEETRFIGKKYGDNDRIDGGFGAKWGEWFTNRWFDIIENQIDKNVAPVCEDDDATIGLQRWKDNEPFEYWIGKFTPENTVVPNEFQFKDFQKSKLGVCWVYGKDVFFKEPECGQKLMKEGFEIVNDENNACWFFERYVPSRFNKKDETGI